MPILLDHQLREEIPHATTGFPVTYYHDELAALPGWEGPAHWHPDFELALAVRETLEYQVGQQRITLQAGDGIFVNGNVLHRVRQLSGRAPDPVPILVFSGTVVAPEQTTIYRRYIQPIAGCDALPCVVFRQSDPDHREILALIRDTVRRMQDPAPCYELAVQRNISRLFEELYRRFDSLPQSEATRIQLRSRVRLQKMLTYIYDHYAGPVTLADIAGAASISRSEADRCFRAYMGCSPVEALIRYRLQTARRMLGEKTGTLQQISAACGFRSVNYFSRKFRQTYGCAPGRYADLGK